MSSSSIVIMPGFSLPRAVLAMGADMKNAVATGSGNEVRLASGAVALETPETVEGMQRSARAMCAALGRPVDAIAVDLHPDMHSTRMGRRLAAEWSVPVVEVQHHLAHAAACLAEHGKHEGWVLVMDGTGWGGDGSVWGAELLEWRHHAVRRCATFSPVPLPGGDAAVRRPARQVIGRWVDAGIRWSDQDLQSLGVTPEEAEVWGQQCAKRLNAPLTHAAGRLFDSFSALLGLAPSVIAQEAEPALLLEAAARSWRGGAVPELPHALVEEAGVLRVDWAPAFRYLHGIPLARDEAARWAMAVHAAVARAAASMIDSALGDTSERCVGVSGGVFANRILNELLERELGHAGIRILRHRQVSPGDGGIALGQAVVASLAETL